MNGTRLLVVCGCAIWALTGLAHAAGDAARPDSAVEVELCAKALEKDGAEHIPRPEFTRIEFGDNRVVVGNADTIGFVCLLVPAGGRLVVADLARGQDVVGVISKPRRVDLPAGSFLLTRQAFRGGSNARREYHVGYAVERGKIRTVLRLPSNKAVFIGNYTLSERNDLTPSRGGLHVSQASIVGVEAERGTERTLYRSGRAFDLTYSAELGAFVEGVGTCVEDVVIGGKTWEKKGRRLGYVIAPGIADAAPLQVELIRSDGARAAIESLTDLVLLRLGTK